MTRLVFFSGGSALNPLASQLAAAQKHATYVVTAFDNGGSSRHLRDAFGVIAVGDMRNRLTAISRGPADLLKLFRMRLPDDEPQQVLRRDVEELAAGCSSLRAMLARTPAGFDWRRGSIGNFILAGRYFEEHCNWTPVLQWVHETLQCVGSVQPVTTTSAQLAAELENGETIVGQQIVTSQAHPIASPIRSIRLLPADPPAYESVLDSIARASAVVYSWGSFYTSVLPALLVPEIPRAIAARAIPRILLLNPARDAELLGKNPFDLVRAIQRYSAITHVIALRPRVLSAISFYNAGALEEVAAGGIIVHTVDCDDLEHGSHVQQVIDLLLETAGEA
jgi:2-phospho-L-lactate transferase/gluconeogenesis factor (CofD/UPF0052 family)